MNGTTSTPGCWEQNTCSDASPTGFGTLRAPVRRPRTISGSSIFCNGRHEGEILRYAVAYVAGMIRRNALGEVAGWVYTDKTWIPLHLDYNEVHNWLMLEVQLDCINYEITRYYSNNMDRFLIAIQPKGWRVDGAPADAQARHWGIYIFNTQPRHYSVIEVPHPRFDLYSELMAAEAFEKGDAFALFVAGGHRYAIDDPDDPRDTWDDVGGLRGKADVAHIAKTIHGRNMVDGNVKPAFQWAHEGLSYAAPDGYALKSRVALGVIQFHGFDEDGSAGTYYRDRGEHVVVSGGVKKGPTATDYLSSNDYPEDAPTGADALRNKIVAGITNARFADDGSFAQVGSPTVNLKAAVPSGTGGLRATLNIQARKSADDGISFVHLEPDCRRARRSARI